MIHATGLRRSFGDRVALDGVSLALPSGTVTAVIGGNGAGKSTLLRALAGLTRADGRVELEPPVAFLPQGGTLPETATAAELRSLFARLAGSPAPSPDPDWLPAGEDRRIGTLSGGEQQRAALAALAALAPRTLLLDEPLANLDDDARVELLARLRALAATGATILLTSPAAEALAGAVDRVLRLERGRLVDTA